jgi:hypothetical protein
VVEVVDVVDPVAVVEAVGATVAGQDWPVEP